MDHFPECRWRVEIKSGGPFFCRHVGHCSNRNLVSPPVCHACSVRLTECSQPRPIPSLEDLEKPPPKRQQAWNIVRSLAVFVADSLRTVTKEQYASRLKVCDQCERRRGDRCLECGCNLALKAHGRLFTCPLDRWPDVESGVQQFRADGQNEKNS